MLTSKVITCPELDKVEDTLRPVTELLMKYCIEVGIQDYAFDVTTLVTEWIGGRLHIMGFYESGELVGVALGQSEPLVFSSIKVLVAKTLYILPEHRSTSAAHIDAAVRGGMAYAKSTGHDGFRIHATGAIARHMETLGGSPAFVSMEFTV